MKYLTAFQQQELKNENLKLKLALLNMLEEMERLGMEKLDCCREARVLVEERKERR